ncbi:MAG: SRPBCC family protein [Ardenticatenaceae bacterium]|nr:SRPBCC family protein [Ardenticatenaceae bacterium]
MPITTTVSRHIDATPEQLWAIVGETDTWPQWHPEITSAFWVSKLVDWVKGATIRVHQVLPAPWGAATLVYRVSTATPPHEVEWDARGDGVDLSAGLKMQPDGSGSRVTWHETIRGLKASLLSWRVGSRRREMGEHLLANLARLAQEGR